MNILIEKKKRWVLMYFDFHGIHFENILQTPASQKCMWINLDSNKTLKVINARNFKWFSFWKFEIQWMAHSLNSKLNNAVKFTHSFIIFEKSVENNMFNGWCWMWVRRTVHLFWIENCENVSGAFQPFSISLALAMRLKTMY